MYWIKLKGKHVILSLKLNTSKSMHIWNYRAFEMYTDDIVCGRQEFKSVLLEYHDSRYLKKKLIS
jgi:hypothetical protein